MATQAKAKAKATKKTFWYIWTYVATYSSPQPIEAASAEHAVAEIARVWGEDFVAKATIYVFDKEPVGIGGCGRDADATRNRIRNHKEQVAAAKRMATGHYCRGCCGPEPKAGTYCPKCGEKSPVTEVTP